jgi:hypothetical protein
LKRKAIEECNEYSDMGGRRTLAGSTLDTSMSSASDIHPGQLSSPRGNDINSLKSVDNNDDTLTITLILTQFLSLSLSLSLIISLTLTINLSR